MNQFPATYSPFLQSPSAHLPELEGLIQDAISQTQKDLSFFKVEWQPTGDDLVSSLTETLQSLENERNKLMQVLYRVDVSQVLLEKMLAENQGDNAWKHLAALVWHRELRKVWLRRQFSDSNSGDLPAAPSV